ncbi:DNA-binding transcriptional regulator, LysR family [Rhodospirillales bacterium URHD0017]|nr:DNA-binding transcriptional regulator, LysR family [Rhodospirillales bacterium URHD0017]
MNQIDLRRFDLNLLVVLDVLMAERGVSRAAARLGRTQSAVSHSLARLREQLGDPLLLKGGRRMEPTAFALELMEQMRPLLQGLQRVLAPRRRFDPATSHRVFRLSVPDFAQAMFIELLTQARRKAPGVSIEWTGPRETMLLELAEGQLDLAIAPAGLRLPQGLAAESIGALQWRCFGRRGHPAFRRWGRRAWTAWPHVVVRVGDQLESPVNIAAGAVGLSRTIAGWLPNFSAVAPVLAASDLLATLPAPAMAGTLGAHRLESRRVPFTIAPLPHVLLWSSVRTQDPEVAWLRRLLAPLAKSRFAATPGAST